MMAAEQQPQMKNFRQEVITVAKKIGKEDLEKIIYYFQDVLPKAKLEKIDDAIPLFTMLEEHGKINNGDIEGLNHLIFHEILQRPNVTFAEQESSELCEEKHIREIDELEIVVVSHSTSKQILAFAERLEKIRSSFQDILQNKIDIQRGPSASKVMTISKFISSECKEYMKTYFSKRDYFAFNDDDTFALLEGFKTHLQNNKPAFLVRNYDLYDHYKFLFDKSFTKSEMPVIHPMDYIGFEAKNKLMYFIKISNAETLKELKRDVNTSSTYLRMFALLHQDILQETGIHLVSIIVISDEFEKLKNEVSKNCQFCPKYIFTKKEFSKFSIGLFLKLRRNSSFEKKNCQTAFNFEDFKCAMGSLFGYMATKPGDLVPNIYEKCSKQIDHFILLYPQQVAVSNLSNKRVIIQGGSGSGKTIIGRQQLKHLSSDPNNKVIYYINCGTSQGFTEEMERFVKKTIGNNVTTTNQNNVTTTDQNSTSKKVHCYSKSKFNTNSLTKMLKIIEGEQKDAETVHVILEEVPLDELNESEMKSLVEVLKSSKFKDGHFKIICQTMSKVRSVLKSDVEVSRTNNNQVDLLKSKADFKLNVLSESVRNPVAIFKLVNIAIEILEKEANSFTLDLKDETVVKRQNSSTKDDMANKESAVTSENDTMASYDRSELLDDDQNVDVSAKKQDSRMSNIPDILDAQFKDLDKQKSQDAERNDVLKTIFSFKTSGKSYHGIEGKKPLLFFLFADEYYNDKDKEQRHYDDKEKICLLTACFYESIQKKYIPWVEEEEEEKEEEEEEEEERVTIIHFEKEPPSLLLSSLKCLEENSISLKYDIKRSLDVHGIEFDNVIIYIDVAEYHMRHYFIEAITRCKVNLVIIAVKEDKKNVQDNVIWKIFKRYEKEELVTVVKVDDLKDVFKNVQGSYKDYIYESSQEKQITESSVSSRTVAQFVASLKPLQQFQHENKEVTRALQPNNEDLAGTHLLKSNNHVRQEVIKLSRKIGNDDLEVIKYYFEDDLPKAELENINNAIPLIKMLEEHGKIKNGDIEGLYHLIFHEILQREDVLQQREIAKFDQKFDIFLQYVSDRIAAIWERLARNLRVPFEEVDNIASDQIKYFGPKKKALAMLRHAKNSYEGLTWQRLRKGLADCNRWDVIRDIESNENFKSIVSGTQASSDIQARDKNMVNFLDPKKPRDIR